MPAVLLRTIPNATPLSLAEDAHVQRVIDVLMSAAWLLGQVCSSCDKDSQNLGTVEGAERFRSETIYGQTFRRSDEAAEDC